MMDRRGPAAVVVAVLATVSLALEMLVLSSDLAARAMLWITVFMSAIATI